MKKIISLVMALVLLCAMSVSVFAADIGDYSAGEGMLRLTAHVYSTYTVTVPAEFNCYAGQCEVTISNAQLETGYHVDLYVTNLSADGTLTLGSDSNPTASIKCTLLNLALGTNASQSVPLVSFYKNDLSNKNTATKAFQVDIIPNSIPGTYFTNLYYSFCCNPDTP